MNIKKTGKLAFIVALILTTALFAVRAGMDSHQDHNHESEIAEDSHAGHEHESEMEEDNHAGHEHESEMKEDDHADHEQESKMEEDDHAGHEHDDHADIVKLSDAAMELGGIEFDTVTKGAIKRVIELPGEISFNRDRMVHITPRFGGIVRDVEVSSGDYVRKGQTLAKIESNESMSQYEIKSPQNGYIVERDIAPGEFAGEDRTLFIVADLTDVWIELAVFAKDEKSIRKGMEVEIDAIGSEQIAKGRISYISRFYSADTRHLTARVVLPNSDNIWKPGNFVKGHVNVESGVERLLVANEAIQIVNQKPALFLVRGYNSFEPINIRTGLKGEQHTEVFSTNIQEGYRYVSKGAFEIKAHLVTSSLDAHAGHGH